MALETVCHSEGRAYNKSHVCREFKPVFTRAHERFHFTASFITASFLRFLHLLCIFGDVVSARRDDSSPSLIITLA